ncbi:UbiX family flavin prenyltransferase [Methanolapillus ohkumae]|uniref:Flavin prenyltransferase UbiX n=1 Tax=Methanolapillus ohkumae TaxID=3028298 RepID=A0AA96V673_9EURY|nr:putative UbiX-like flavin prenyltransferase [Methanosarcinaceae archaeon Am2]
MTVEIVIGISGASGAGYGIRLLEILNRMNKQAKMNATPAEKIKIHLVMTKSAEDIIRIETDKTPEDIKKLADFVYDEKDFTAPIASGSYRVLGMIIAPCSMKTLGQIANGISDNLLARAADVCLKDERKLILMTRETPLNLIHLENMVTAKKAGATILPASPGFYSRPQTIDDLYDIMTGRALDLIGIENDVYKRWKHQP